MDGNVNRQTTSAYKLTVTYCMRTWHAEDVIGAQTSASTWIYSSLSQGLDGALLKLLSLISLIEQYVFSNCQIFYILY